MYSMPSLSVVILERECWTVAQLEFSLVWSEQFEVLIQEID